MHKIGTLEKNAKIAIALFYCQTSGFMDVICLEHITHYIMRHQNF